MDDSPVSIPSIGGARRKCLLGVTITLVEDSLSASEALRLMAVASGARLRRADRLITAERHLSLYRPNVVIVDLGLPDGSGLDLIEKMSKVERGRPGVIALSGRDVEEWGEAAREAGADAVMPKPIGSIATFQTSVLSVLPDRENRTQPVPSVGSTKSLLTQQIKIEDLAHALKLLDGAGSEMDLDALAYAAQFAASLAVMLEDKALQLDARVLMEAEQFDEATKSAISHLSDQLSSRIGRLADGTTG